jgi:CHASE2 domain-containing sensor protein
MIVGVLVAILVTGSLFGGYLLLRKRHQQKVFAAAQAAAPKPTEPKGSAKAQILVDEALLKGDQTILGGTVRNISNENLSGLSVELDLVRRKGGQVERVSAPVQPAQLSPQQEGRYSLQRPSADYRGAKLVGLRSGDSLAQLVYVAAPGQKRPPEKLEAKTIIVGRPAPGKGEFLNTPDTPVRVP